MKSINTTSNKNNNMNDEQNNKTNGVNTMRYNLFNNKDINNMVTDLKIKPTKEQEEAINQWAELLQNEMKEKENYLKFYDIIIKKLLGFNTEEVAFEEKIDGKHPVEFTINDITVIEVKGTKTKDLTKRVRGEQSPVEQAFNYASKTEGIKWIIVTNYNEIRLYNYIKGQDKYMEFNFKKMAEDRNELKRFLLIFSKFGAFTNNSINILLENKKTVERHIENNTYKLVAEIKNMYVKILKEICGEDKNTAEHVAIEMVARQLFINSIEDKGIIKNNNTFHDTIVTPIESNNIGRNHIHQNICKLHEDVKEGNTYKGIPEIHITLFSRHDYSGFKIPDFIEDETFFKDCKTGWELDEKYDDINDIIKNHKQLNTLYKNLLVLSSIDFTTELDSDILGNIFERIMNNEKQDATGAFYTPREITTMIVTYTICKYLSKTGKSTNCKQLIKEYKGKYKQLITKLEALKIVDPACGSGAFLIKVVDVLFNIYKTAYGEVYTRVPNDYKLYNRIIKHNIYGVDINPNAVEIAQLSIYLKMISSEIKNIYKIDDINSHIKNGNSVITKEFDWEKEFPEVFNRGGFDIVVGNPPYLRQEAEAVKKIKPELEKEYKVYTGKADLSVYFFEKALNILKPKGIIGYICTNSYERSEYGQKLRTLILKNTIHKYIDHTCDTTLFNASVDTSTIIIEKNNPSKNHEISVNNEYLLKQSLMNDETFTYDKITAELNYKINNKGKPIEELDIQVKSGIKTGCNDAFIIDKETRNTLIAKNNKNSEIIVPISGGKDIKRWNYTQEKYLINAFKNLNIEKEYPDIHKYLMDKQNQLREEGKLKKDNKYNMTTTDQSKVFNQNKIIYGNITKKSNFTYDDKKSFILNSATSLRSDSYDLKTITGLINSKLIFWFIKQISLKVRGGYSSITTTAIKRIPLIIPEDNTIANKVDEIMKLKENNKELKESFNNWFKIEFNKEVKFDETIEAKDFLRNNHINGRKKQLEVTKEYNEVKEQITTNNNQIATLENEIDKIVYKLYDLTEEEIAIIEDSY